MSISLATDPIEEVQLLREMGRDLAEVGSLPGAKVLFEAARVLMPEQPEVYTCAYASGVTPGTHSSARSHS